MNMFLYVLGIIVVMATLVVMTIDDDSSSSSIEMAKVSQIPQQIDLISIAVERCRQVYPVGSPAALASWPAQPSGTPPLLNNTTCPGAPTGNNALFSIINGNPPVRVPDGWNNWEYYNDVNGARIVISTSVNLTDRQRNFLCKHFQNRFTSGTAQISTSTNPVTLTYWLRRTSLPAESLCV